MRKGIHIGCSGWSYDDWVGPFYESKKKMLSQYLEYFTTAEINSTFYSLPSDGFIGYLAYGLETDSFFTAKLPKVVTHENRLDLSGDAGEHLKEFHNRMEPMKDKLEALLIQLPPWSIDKMADPEAFFAGLDYSFRYAIEFRDQTWLDESIWELLEDYGIAHVIVDEPKLPINMRVTTDFAYIRWHGHGFSPWYDYLYSEDQLREWAPRIKELQEQVDTVIGYFNNHFSGKAPLNAFQMLQILGKATHEQEEKAKEIQSVLEAQTTIPEHISDTDEMQGLLLKRTDQGRYERGQNEVANTDIRKDTKGRIEAQVKSYNVIIDTDDREIHHDCADYKRHKEEKRFCKHLVGVFLSLPENHAQIILQEITHNLGDWTFL